MKTYDAQIIILKDASVRIEYLLSSACTWGQGYKNVWWIPFIRSLLSEFQTGNRAEVLQAMRQILIILHVADREDNPIQPLWVKHEIIAVRDYIACLLGAF